MNGSKQRKAGSKQRKTQTLVLSFALCALRFALPSTTGAISDSAGTKNGSFLKIATDARGVALGPSVVSMVRGVDSLRWNPAGLGHSDSKEVAATHVQYYQDIRIEHVAFAYPLEESALAVSALYLSPGGTLDGRDILGNSTGDFKFYNLVGTLGYGRRIFTRAEGAEVSVGAAVKIVQEKIAESQFQNPALDFGALVSPWEDFQAGFSLRNLSSSKANFPKDILGGVSYTVLRTLTGAFAVRYADDAPVRVSVGGEYKFPDYQSVIRAGYQTHDSLDDSTDSAISALRSGSLAGITMGAGFGYRPPILQGVTLNLDYAMAPFGALGISHTITVKIRW